MSLLPALPTRWTLLTLACLALACLALACLAGPAMAHSDLGPAAGFGAGLAHPFGGLDHVAAMVAVGLWGAILGPPALWTLPVVFPLVMALGGAAGVLGLPLPGVEVAIALSAVALGLAVAFAARPPLWIAAALVGAFAIFHGHAHGTALPHAAGAVGFGAGFVIATGTLHMAGVALGALARGPRGALALRAGGGLVAAVGVGFLTGAI